MQKYFLHIFIVFSLTFVGAASYAAYQFGTASASPIIDSVPMPQKGGESIQEDQEPQSPESGAPKVKADVFTGTLEEVNTGCFADGECYIVVDGKHVTTLRGWSQDTVGTVEGVEGFGDLENHIGKKIEVYAQVNLDDTYTLYGSEGFYVKLLDGKGTPAPTKPVAGAGCVIGGCSGQLCVDASKGDVVSTCEWTESYACYQTATCEKQATGQCGWTETKELNQCLADAKSSDAMMVQ